MPRKPQPLSLRLIYILVGLLLVAVPSIANDDSEDSGEDASGAEVVQILNPRHPSNPAPPDPTPDGVTPSGSQVACATLHMGLRRNAPGTIALGLLMLGTSSVAEALEMCG